MTDNEIKQICDQLNNTSRKCLGWKTPAEVFREKMMEEMRNSPHPQRQYESRFTYRSQLPLTGSNWCAV
jgi:IS30 family transposase